MFLGHFAIGMAAKKVRPELSLPLLLTAAQFLDLLWPTFLLLGIEHVEIAHGGNIPLIFSDYPISHGLFFVLVWALIFGVVYQLVRRDQSGAIVLSLLVASHWFLDFLVHIPDLPLLPGSDLRAGLGLWNYRWLAVLMEFVALGTGVYVYVKTLTQQGQKVSIWFWVMIALLVIIQLSDLLGPPPESADMIGWLAHFQWLIIALAWLAERKRQPSPVAVHSK